MSDGAAGRFKPQQNILFLAFTAVQALAIRNVCLYLCTPLCVLISTTYTHILTWHENDCYLAASGQVGV